MRTRHEGVAGADLAGRHGSSAVAGLVRRGLLDAEIRERPRRPLAGRPVGLRGGRPPATDLLPAQAAALSLIREAVAAGDPTPLLLDGVTGGGKTAVYIEAIAATLAAGRSALVLVPEIALALPSSTGSGPTSTSGWRCVHSGLGDGERADEWRRIRGGDVDVVVGTRLGGPGAARRRRPRHRRRGARRRLQERPDAAPPGPRRRHRARPARRRGGRPRERDARRSRASASPGAAATGTRSSPTGRPGPRPDVTVVDLRAELAAGKRGLLSRPLAAAIAGLDTAARRPGHPRDQPARHARRSSVPGLRPRPGLSGLRAPARLPPGRDDAALPPLRPGHAARRPAARTATRRGSATSAAAPSASSARSGERFPALRVGRLDRDVVERRGAAERVIDALRRRPRSTSSSGPASSRRASTSRTVTLVGVVSADVALNLPDERAAERTYQLLAQAVGPGGPRRPAGPRDHPDLPAGPSGDPGRGRPATRPRSTTPSSSSAAGSGRRRSAGSSS